MTLQSLLRALVALALLAISVVARAQASPSAYTSGIRYDAAGRVTGTIAPDPDGSGVLHFAAVRNSYDGAGRLTKVETGELVAWQSEQVAAADWAGFSVFRTLEIYYDSRDRKIRETLREGASGTIRTLTQYSYDNLGRLTCTAVRMNESQFSGTLPDACTQAGGAVSDRITRSVYDAAGQRLQLREGLGTIDEGTEATWAYSPNGRITTVIDGNGNRAQLHYDGYDRQDCWIFPSTTRAGAFNDSTPANALATANAVSGDCVTTGDYERYGYDNAGNRTSLRKRDAATAGPSYTGTITYQYDGLNRMIAKIVPERPSGSQLLAAAQTRDVYYSYDLRNLQFSALFDSQAGEGVTNTYDGFGRLASSSTNMGGTNRTLSYQYDANGNRTRIIHPDTNYFDTLYDGLNRPTGLLLNGTIAVRYASYKAFGALSSFGSTVYSYDGVQRPAGRTHYFGGTPGSVGSTYVHNPAGQLNQVTIDNDAYAWTGHYAVNRPYTINGLNQYTGAGSASLSYDANGNLVSDGSNNYLYDVENRLVSASGGHNAGLTYDPLGRLWQVTNGSSTTRFLYDGDALVAEYDGTGTMTHRYAHWVGADVPVVSYDNNGLTAPHLLATDHQGSIIAITDAAANVLAIDTYDEYGIPGASNTGRFQYTGQAWLAELGMYYYKARIYSPTLGRFMQTDPIGYADQFNLYEYVGDDPLNRTDPTGNAWAIPAPAAGVAGACAGPQGLGCGLVATALCNLSSACRGAVDGFLNSRVGSSLMCAAGNCTWWVQGLMNEARQDRDYEAVTIDRTGKWHRSSGPMPDPDDFDPDNRDEDIRNLRRDIQTRRDELDRFDRMGRGGNRNGTPQERADWQRQQQHREELTRRERLLRELTQRQRDR